ncbi:MAG: hypothetical protein ABR604_08700 [Jatrophihabitantaceae bacterium]
MSDAVRAGAVAAVCSGAPSTVWAVLRGTDPLAPSLAAGAMLLPRSSRRSSLLMAAAAVHTVLSLGWAQVLAAAAGPRESTVTSGLLRGAAGGLGIAALDLGLAHAASSPRLEKVRALPVLPQVADHVAFGALVAGLLAHYGAVRRRG